MAQRWIGGAAIALFVAIAGVTYWKSNARQPVSAAANRSDEVAALRAEVTELKRNSAAGLLLAARAADERSPVLAGANRALAPAEPAPPAAAPATEPEDPAAERRAEMAMAENLDRKFAAEPVDRAWAGSASDEAKRALLSEIAADTSLQKVDCRTNWCRIETVHDSVQAFIAFTQKSLLSRDRKLWNGAFSSNIREESESGVIGVTFFSREGQPLPLPDGAEPTAQAAR